MPLNGAVFALDGILIGAGDTRFLMWGMLAASAVYVPVALLALGRRLGHPRRLVRPGGADRRPAGDVRRRASPASAGRARARSAPYHDAAAMTPPSPRCSPLLVLARSPRRAALAADRPARGRRRPVRPAAAGRAGGDADADAARRRSRRSRTPTARCCSRSAAALLVLFVVIGCVITRDARKTLPEASAAPRRPGAARPGPAPPRPRDEGEGAREDQGAAPRAAPER